MVIGDDHGDGKDNLKTTSATRVMAGYHHTQQVAPDQIFALKSDQMFALKSVQIFASKSGQVLV